MEQFQELMKRSLNAAAERKLPRWRDLPDLDIYMDQVLSLISRYLEGYPGFDKKGLTSSMVNNYVKAGIIPAPVKKKYNRAHLADLVMVCVLKTVMPIPQIGEILAARAEGTSHETLYDRFCDYFDRVTRSVAESTRAMFECGADSSDTVLFAALRAHAEQSVAMDLAAALSSRTNMEAEV